MQKDGYESSCMRVGHHRGWPQHPSKRNNYSPRRGVWVKEWFIRLRRVHLATSIVCMSERAQDNFKEVCTVQRHFSSIIFFAAFPHFQFLKTFPEQQKGNFPVTVLIHLLFVKILFFDKRLISCMVSPPPYDRTPPKKSIKHAWLREHIYSIIKSPRSSLNLQNNVS